MTKRIYIGQEDAFYGPEWGLERFIESKAIYPHRTTLPVLWNYSFGKGSDDLGIATDFERDLENGELFMTITMPTPDLENESLFDFGYYLVDIEDEKCDGVRHVTQARLVGIGVTPIYKFPGSIK